MFTGYKKEESEMPRYNLHPEGTESEDLNATDNTAGHSSGIEVKDIAADTTIDFNNNGRFEYNMDGESLW